MSLSQTRSISLLFFLLLFKVVFSQQIEQTNSEKYPVITFGFSVKTLMDVQQTDAEAGLKVLVDRVASDQGFKRTFYTNIISTLDEAVKSLNLDQIDMISLVSQEYVEIKNLVEIVPMYVPLRNGSVFEKFLLIVHESQAGVEIKDWKNKNIIIGTTQENELPSVWLDNLLLKQNLPDHKIFFNNVKSVAQPSRAVLPVFFKNAQACIVFASSFQTITELNPQLGKELVVLLESEPILMSVLCFNKSLNAADTDSLKIGIEELSKSTRGKQILKIFKIEDHTPFKESYLKSVSTMLEERRRSEIKD